MTQPPAARPGEPARILIVDDDDAVRGALARFVQKSGYLPAQAADGNAALDLLKQHTFAGMLCDLRMPGMTGVELLPRAVAHDPDLVIIMLTAVGDPASAIQCLKLGAVDYLIKPVELEELAHALRYGLRKRELEIERRGMEQWLSREVAAKTRELEEQGRQVELLSLSILMALVDESEEPGTGVRNHSMRVANLSAHVAAELGQTGDGVEMVRLAARVHDVGRVAQRDERLRRVSRHDGPPDETLEADAAAVAARILEPLRRYGDMAVIIKFQHEHWDGTGRPEGRQGEAIPLGSRIIRATNMYDELSEGSAGQPALPPAEAYQKMQDAAGSELDPAVVTALAKVLERRRSLGIKSPASPPA